jgi:NADH-quinone oxidoreductase subunit G/NADP-reducing hydrogenase subunit HndD
MTVKAGSAEIRMGTVSGLSNAVALIEELQSGKRKLDILEVMACPDGCINGGGQPIQADENLIRTRAKAVYDMDNGSSIHTAHRSREIEEVYKDYLKEAGGKLSRKLLHTSYSKREVLL